MIAKMRFTFLVIALTMSMTSVACTQQEDAKTSADTKTEPDQQMLAQNTQATANAEVYEIMSVGSPEAGKATDFTWKENDEVMSFNDYTKGKVVFLNFWGTWCPPCRMEIPDIIEISKELDKDKFVVIGIAMEKARTLDEAKQRVASYASAKGIPYKNFIGVQEIMQAYGGINNVPTTFIIDVDGNISKTIVGMRDKEAFMKYINMVLK